MHFQGVKFLTLYYTAIIQVRPEYEINAFHSFSALLNMMRKSNETVSDRLSFQVGENGNE